MKEELFAELLDSVRQGGRILRGELKPSRASLLQLGAQRDRSERIESALCREYPNVLNSAIRSGGRE